MKKTLVVSLLLIFLFVFSACNAETAKTEKCAHTSTVWIEDSVPTLCVDGYSREVCTDCGAFLGQSVTPYQLWDISPCYGTITIQSYNGQYLSHSGQTPSISAQQTVWILESCEDNRYYIKDATGFYVLEYYGGVLKLENDTGYTEQQWIIKHDKNGAMIIEHADSPNHYLCAGANGTLSVVHKSDADVCCLWSFPETNLTDGYPYTEIIGQKGIISLRLDPVVYNVITHDRLQQWANDLEAAYTSYAELTGWVPFDAIEIRGYTNCGGWGYVYRNKPVIHVNKDCMYEDLQKMSRRENDWNFGVLHEMGHLFDRDHWAFEWETLAQYKLGYVLFKNNASAAPSEFDASEVFSHTTMIDAYHRLGGKLAENRAPIDKPLAAKLFQVTEIVGWDSIAYAFQNMPHRYDLSQLEILESFLSLISSYSGIDAKALFTDREWLVLENTLH